MTLPMQLSSTSIVDICKFKGPKTNKVHQLNGDNITDALQRS